MIMDKLIYMGSIKHDKQIYYKKNHNAIKKQMMCSHDKYKRGCKICCPKMCEICDHLFSEISYRQHLTTKKHKYNDSWDIKYS